MLSKKQPTKKNPPGQGRSRSARRRRAARERSSVMDRPVQPIKANIRGGAFSPGNELAMRYAKVLDDPFRNEPVALGFGCLVPTNISVARVTTQITSNGTDGSATLIARPNARVPLAYQATLTGNNPVTATAWSWVTDSAWTTVNACFENARPIALGLRITPMSAATDKPSQIVTGQINYSDKSSVGLLAALNAATTDTLYTSHNGTKVVCGSGGLATVEQTWRPMSMENFEFQTNFFDAVPALSNTAVYPQVGPVIYAAIAGPVALKYDVEVIYYYEALSSFAGITPGVQHKESASDFFPSMDTFYSKVSSLLTDDNVGHIANLASTVGTVWKRYSANDRLIPYRPLLQQHVAEEELGSDEDHKHGNLSDEASSAVLRQLLGVSARQRG